MLAISMGLKLRKKTTMNLISTSLNMATCLMIYDKEQKFTIEIHNLYITKVFFIIDFLKVYSYNALEKIKQKNALEKAYSGISRDYQSRPKLCFQIKRISYYQPSMMKDCIDFAKKYKACQFLMNLIYQPLEPLHLTIVSWPFDVWGLDVVGPFISKSLIGHLYILAITNYFLEQAKAKAFKEVKKEVVINFIYGNILF